MELIIIVLLIYFLPTFTAWSKKHHNLSAICIVNLFLGWTFIGWVVALAMASTQVKKVV